MNVNQYDHHSDHVPVLINEVVQYMQPQTGKLYVDGTFGAGGYSRGVLSHKGAKLVGIDRDPNVKTYVEQLKADFPDDFVFLQGSFSQMKDLLDAQGLSEVDGIVLDIGVSSMQIDNAERGFSFQKNGPLDMRMSGDGMDAADWVNAATQEEIANVLYRYGGEKRSRHVARAIIKHREEEPITTTAQLADIVRSVVRQGKEKIDPATRTFQAIRIMINDELGELERVLEVAASLLAPGGRFVVVTFHSLEDRMVKHFFADKAGKNKGVSRHVPEHMLPQKNKIEFKLVTNKAVVPTEDEVKNNPRARSAKLRCLEKINHGGVTS